MSAVSAQFSYLSQLACTACGASVSADELQNLCPRCGKVLSPQYDLDAARSVLTRDALSQRPFTLWRYHEVLPVRDPAYVISLGEGGTPLLPLQRFGATIGLSQLFAKDEGRNPTCSFKARGLSVAVSRAWELGASVVAIPSTGNAGSAMAAYAARAGLEARVFLPKASPTIMQMEAAVYGAHVTLVEGLLDRAGAVSREQSAAQGWFDISTLREPYRVEGKKTMGYEIVEQLGWSVPDVILYPTGGGTGIIAMWKAFAELEELGLIGPQRPRFVSVQSVGCAPIVRAFEAGWDSAPAWEDVETVASGLRAPATIGDYLILRVLRESGGAGVTVTDDEMRATARDVARLEGLFVSLESAATYVAARKLRERGELRGDERVVAFNTAAGLKHADLMESGAPAAG
jgi:threonine synthase